VQKKLLQFTWMISTVESTEVDCWKENNKHYNNYQQLLIFILIFIKPIEIFITIVEIFGDNFTINRKYCW